jgi:outer membrane protein, heavy metal efflux system
MHWRLPMSSRYVRAAGRMAAIAAILAGSLAAERITLDRALELAELGSPLLRVAGAQIDAAGAGIVTARAYPNPEIAGMAGRQRARVAGVPPGGYYAFSFSQPLELPSIRQTRLRVAELTLESTGFARSEARLAVRSAVKQAFFDCLRRGGEITLARENLDLIEDLRRRIEIRVSVGEAGKLELVRADAEVATTRTVVRSAQLRRMNAVAALRAAMNAPADSDLEPEGALSPPAVLPALDALREEVLANFPALALARAEIRRAEARLASEIALRKPQPALISEYESEPEIHTFRFGVAIPIPGWNKRKGPIAEAEASLRQMRALADLRRLEITAALEAAYGRYQVGNQQVAAFEQGALKQAEAALKGAEAAYQFGERGILEVLDAQRVLRAVRLDHLNAQFDRQSALIELEQLRSLDAGRRNP